MSDGKQSIKSSAPTTRTEQLRDAIQEVFCDSNCGTCTLFNSIGGCQHVGIKTIMNILRSHGMVFKEEGELPKCPISEEQVLDGLYNKDSESPQWGRTFYMEAQMIMLDAGYTKTSPIEEI